MLAKFKALAFVGLLLGISTAAQAQAFDTFRNYGAKISEDGGTVGVGALYSSKYRGSKAQEWRVLPLLDYRWSNGFFAGTRNGLGYDFSRSEGEQYGLRITADLGRDETDNPRLTGLGDIQIRPEIGGFFNYSLGQGLQFTSSLRYGSGNDRKGLVADLGLSYVRPLTQQLYLGLGGGLSLVNGSYMQEYFGVSGTQAASSGLAATQAKAGLRDVRANLLLSYYLSQRMGVSFGISASQLQGDAKNSPVTEKSTSVSGLAGFSYTF
ncbi:outer membrane scaffolding protein for murein synthesis (MipA/OmpV family) [Paucibacter oligotrophus]|uniref:Outer membrane scaffolding protein for murein synthesis (MipA/OmpV family) n=1 Tax=Roseateles oligotrophus TaxID=1769250 RepID=A0A840LBS0_9BURK|nr:MipA/OmpV family protein [Roseateles oligotrophus]MBB4843638.1 outer membrane scaffolding protein for murein synthesis (MipA/OmpV family) [Roseateles oligotrophus]